MKKRLFLLLLAAALVLSACGRGHDHTFSGEYSSDETHHWFACECGEKDGYEKHTWNKGSVTLQPTTEREGELTLTCTVCRATKVEKIDKLTWDHTHTYEFENSDETHHWAECLCGKRQGSAQHSWDAGTVTIPATETETGIMTFACTECVRKHTEFIPASGFVGMSFLQSTHYKMTDRLAKTPLTLEAEILVDPSQTGRVGAIFGNYMGIRQDWLFEIYENGVPRFYYTDAAGNIRDYKFTNVDVRTGEWVHIALAFDYVGGTISLYLDGEIAQIITCNMDLAEDITTYRFVVGGDNRSNNGIYFRGKMRSVAAYSDVRTAEEIARAAEKGTNLYADDLLVAYLLSESNEGGEIKDLSGNGYDIAKEWLDSHEPELDYAYSFAVVGDTQWLSKYKPEKMEGIYDWILANKDSKKITHVFGLGDITEDWNTANKEQEWIRAQQYISKLNGVIPYSLVRGNHDESKYFFKYFDNDTYKSQFDGFVGGDDISNSYMLVTIGSTDYLFMTLDFGASDEMLEWANEVVLAHPNRRVIVTTHGYQGFDGEHLTSNNTPSSGGIHSGSDVDTSVGENVRGYNNGAQIWEKFISKHPNIFLVMSGHTPDEDILLLQTTGNHGNVVNQLLIDPQWMDPQKDGVGMVAMLYFSADGKQMEVEWISTDTGKYYKAHNQFALDLTDSLSAPAHAFKESYNDNYHHMACACGYTYGEEAHTFDGGVLNEDGFMVYSCSCGYQRVASATDDPIALALQAMLEKYYYGGVYYKETTVGASSATTFYNGDRFWTTDDADYKNTGDHLTLKDVILGRYGDLKMDLGWNCLEGVYSSANESTINGIKQFAEVDAAAVTKVTVEAKGAHAVIKLWNDSSLYAEVKIGAYATTTLVTHAGETLDVLYTKSGDDYMCQIITPAFDGYVAQYDKIILDTRHSELTKMVYYSAVSVWDGVSVSESLKGSGTAEDPYLVESGADLAYIAREVNKVAAQVSAFSGRYFKMTKSIDLNGHNLFIGGSSAWATRQIFGGFFDGNYCTIRGLNNTKSLFAAVEGGWLKNLSVYGKVSGGATIGGIVGYVANDGTLENLTSYVTVTGTDTLGGIVGNAENQASSVINCVNYGNVTGSSWNVGGIAGSGGHDITGCVNFGNVSSTGSDNVGGIAGTTKNTGAISKCYNYGVISTVHGRAGGIVGLGKKPIIDCVNYGDVNAGWDSGGILGYVSVDASASVINCINNGNVTGETGMGGIFGFAGSTTQKATSVIITGCTNNGKVTGTWGVGGIVANNQHVVNAEISGCVNNGTLSAKGELGGIAGKASGRITGCTNNGIVTGAQDIIGGIVGHLHDLTYLAEINTTNDNLGTVTGPNSKELVGKAAGAITANDSIIGINHRGWYEAPENTLSAYRESAKHGFKYVECDVQFTLDGIPVLLHDDTIDRTSNGSGTLSQMTYAELLQYDFSYDDKDTTINFSAYRGEKIPTFAEFIALCKELNLHPYIEIKGTITTEQANELLQIVTDAGMVNDVSWLSFSGDALAKIAAACPTARIVWVITDVDAAKLGATHVPFAEANLMTGENEVIFDLWYSLAKQDVVDLLKAHSILLEVWTVNDPGIILGLHPYVTGVSSDKYDAGQIVADAKASK